MEMGRLTSFTHRKPIHDNWQWHTTGWTLWFVCCWKGQVGSIYINSNTTPSDTWLQTASPTKTVEGWTCQVQCSCFHGWWYSHLGKCAKKGTQHPFRAAVNIFHLQEEEELPILKNLMKEEVSEYRRKAKVIAWANQLTRQYKKLKWKSNTGCPIQPKQLRLKDEPLNAATRPSVGCLKSKKADMNDWHRYESPHLSPVFSFNRLTFHIWLSIILSQVTVTLLLTLLLSIKNWKEQGAFLLTLVP